MRLIELIGQKN